MNNNNLKKEINLINFSDPITTNVNSNINKSSNDKINKEINLIDLRDRILIKVMIILKTDWYPSLPVYHTLYISCYPNSTGRYLRTIYADMINISEGSIFLCNNGIAFDVDKTFKDYNIYVDVQLDAYLVPGIEIK